MNYEEMKDTLLEIVKEANNLPSTDLEKISGTNIYVKKGRAEEFKSFAYQYFQYKYNLKINDGIDYATLVYNEINQELKEEANEHYISKSYEIATLTKNKMERLDVLKSSLNTLYSNYANLKKDIILANENDELSKLTDLIAELNKVSSNIKLFKDEIIEIKNTVNGEVIKTIDEEMALIRKLYLGTTPETMETFGLDGRSILAKDKEEYDSLYTLKQMLENVKDNNIINVDNFLCINEADESKALELISKINIFKNIKAPIIDKPPVIEPKTPDVNIESVPGPKDVNKDLIAIIDTELKKLEEKRIKQKKASIPAENDVRILKEDYAEYSNLLKIKEILNRAPNENGILIWDKAYVDTNDALLIQSYMNNTELFKDLNPEVKKYKDMLAENAYQITKLKNYIDTLTQNIPKGFRIATRQVKLDEDNIWTIDEKDYEEAVKVIEVIRMLQDQDKDLEKVWDIGYVKPENVDKFKSLVSETKYYEPSIPQEAIAPVITKNVEDNLNSPLVDAIENIVENEEQPIIENANSEKNVESLVPSLNQDKIIELNLELQSLMVSNTSSDAFQINDIYYNNKDESKVRAIIKMLDCLENAQKSSNLVKLNNVVLDQNDVTKYQEAEKEYHDSKHNSNNNEPPRPNSSNSDSKDPILEPKKANKVLGRIRKIRNINASEFIKTHWKVIVASGLSIAAVTYFINALPTLPVALVYANSCNALAFPPLAGFFNTLSSIIGKLAGITFTNGAWLTTSGSIINVGVAASYALDATIKAIAPIVGLTAALVMDSKLIKENRHEIPNPEVNTSLNKIKTLISKMRTIPRGIKSGIDKFNYMMRPYPEEVLEVPAPNTEAEKAFFAEARKDIELSEQKNIADNKSFEDIIEGMTRI